MRKSDDMKFDDVWERYSEQLLIFIRIKVGDTATASDLHQEVGLKLHVALAQNAEIRNYQTWLFQVARNTIADYYRKLKRHESVEIASDLNITDTPSSACICDLSGFVIQTYLPEADAVPLYLSDIEQIPQKEVAQILNLSLTATKSRIQRARVRLQAMITECVEVIYNDKGQIIDFNLKSNCELPRELKEEMERINLSL